MESIESYEHNGLTIHIHPDRDAQNPRTEWDPMGTILSFHRSGDYGDTTPSDIPGYEGITATNVEEAIEQWTALLKKNGSRVVLPVWHYTHSGTTIRTGEANPFHCRWDSGLLGLIYDTPEKLEQWCGKPTDSWHFEPTDESIKACLEGEVATYDQYLQGDVYGYIIETADDDHAESCWGYYGIDDCKQEAESVVDHMVKRESDQAAAIDRMMHL